MICNIIFCIFGAFLVQIAFKDFRKSNIRSPSSMASSWSHVWQTFHFCEAIIPPFLIFFKRTQLFVFHICCFFLFWKDAISFYSHHFLYPVIHPSYTPKLSTRVIRQLSARVIHPFFWYFPIWLTSSLNWQSSVGMKFRHFFQRFVGKRIPCRNKWK